MNISKKKFLLFALIALVALLPELAFASNTSGGNDGSAIFGDVLTMLIGFCQGALGKFIAIVAFLSGMIAGVAKGSFMAVLTGAGFAIAMYYGPQAILSFFGASM